MTGRLKDGILIECAEDAGLVETVLRAPCIELLKWYGVPFKTTADGIRMGSFGSESNQPKRCIKSWLKVRFTPVFTE